MEPDVCTKDIGEVPMRQFKELALVCCDSCDRGQNSPNIFVRETRQDDDLTHIQIVLGREDGGSAFVHTENFELSVTLPPGPIVSAVSQGWTVNLVRVTASQDEICFSILAVAPGTAPDGEGRGNAVVLRIEAGEILILPDRPEMWTIMELWEWTSAF